MSNLQRKMSTAGDLRSVVRTMKAMAAASISQYEKAMISLDDYYHTVELALVACFANQSAQSHKGQFLSPASENLSTKKSTYTSSIGAIVFGSDQGLVGQFNNILVSFVAQELAKLPGKKRYWSVGERMQAQLNAKKPVTERNFALPRDIDSIMPLVAELLTDIHAQQKQYKFEQVYLFYNQPKSKTSYYPVCHRLLPLDSQWQNELATTRWPTKQQPQLLNDINKTLGALVQEYLFVSIFKACSASLASENASRLIAMQRAEKNIEELQQGLLHKYHHQRQSSIDKELFDLVGGFEALTEASL